VDSGTSSKTATKRRKLVTRVAGDRGPGTWHSPKRPAREMQATTVFAPLHVVIAVELEMLFYLSFKMRWSSPLDRA